MKIGVFGPHGRLGSALVAMGCDPIECDITKEDEVKHGVRSGKFDVLINCAAYTSVDDAELPENQKVLIDTNLSALHNIYKHSLQSHVIHISTDYVFGGHRGPYTEKSRFIKSDLPVNQYGSSKFGAEAWLNGLPLVTVVRTTGLFGNGYDLVQYVHDVVSKVDYTPTIMGVTDLVANQTYIPFLAESLIRLADMKYGHRPPILHLASSDVCSRYEFMCRVSDRMEKKFGRSASIAQVKQSEISSWIAKRPVRGGLDTTYSKQLGFRQFTIDDGLEAYFA